MCSPGSGAPLPSPKLKARSECKPLHPPSIGGQLATHSAHGRLPVRVLFGGRLGEAGVYCQAQPESRVPCPLAL